MKYVPYILCLLFLIFNNLNAQEFSHKLYGYSQLDYKASNDPNMLEGFHLTRINLIDDFTLQGNARFVVDLELEDGPDLSTDRLTGSIIVSRGYFEYSFQNDIIFSFGKMLTPFGLYNETHDFTITYLPIEVPLPYRSFLPLSDSGSTRIFSKYSTGISVKDTTKIFDKYNWTNQVTVSNGAKDTLKGTDTNHDKAISLKSNFKYLQDENIYETGFSVYTEKDSSVFEGMVDRRFWTNAIHFKFENDRFNFSTEALYSAFASATQTSQKALAIYGCLGYTINEKLIPYVLYTKAYRDLSNKKNFDKDIILGINSNILPQVVLKIEYTRSEREIAEVDKNFQTIATDLAITF